MAKDPSSLKGLLKGFPLKERRTQTPGDGHILEDASLALNLESHNFFSCLTIAPRELDQLVKPASGLEEGVSQMEGKGCAIALLPDLRYSRSRRMSARRR